MGKDLNSITRKDVLMEKKHRKRCLTSEQPLKITGKMQIKTEMRYHYTSVKIAKIKNIDSIK